MSSISFKYFLSLTRRELVDFIDLEIFAASLAIFGTYYSTLKYQALHAVFVKGTFSGAALKKNNNYKTGKSLRYFQPFVTSFRLLQSEISHVFQQLFSHFLLKRKMVATDNSFQKFLTFPCLFPDKNKIFLTR